MKRTGLLLIGPTNVYIVIDNESNECHARHRPVALLPRHRRHRLVHPRRRTRAQDAVGGLDARPPARGAAWLRAFRQAGTRRAAHGRGREPDRFRPPHHAGRGGALGRALAQGASAARSGSAFRTTTPKRSSPTFSPASTIAIRWSRSRSSARIRSSSPRRCARAPWNSRSSPIIEGLRGVELIREEPLVWVAKSSGSGRGGRAGSFGARKPLVHLAARGGRGARGSPRATRACSSPRTIPPSARSCARAWP